MLEKPPFLGQGRAPLSLLYSPLFLSSVWENPPISHASWHLPHPHTMPRVHLRPSTCLVRKPHGMNPHRPHSQTSWALRLGVPWPELQEEVSEMDGVPQYLQLMLPRSVMRRGDGRCHHTPRVSGSPTAGPMPAWIEPASVSVAGLMCQGTAHPSA